MTTPATEPGPGDTFPCTWLVEHRRVCRVPLSEPCGYCEDGGYQAEECGAPARLRADGSGFDCKAGHEHTTAEARQARGWDYAEDQGEAEGLARAGVEPRTMDYGQVIRARLEVS